MDRFSALQVILWAVFLAMLVAIILGFPVPVPLVLVVTLSSLAVSIVKAAVGRRN